MIPFSVFYCLYVSPLNSQKGKHAMVAAYFCACDFNVKEEKEQAAEAIAMLAVIKNTIEL